MTTRSPYELDPATFHTDFRAIVFYRAIAWMKDGSLRWECNHLHETQLEAHKCAARDAFVPAFGTITKGKDA